MALLRLLRTGEALSARELSSRAGLSESDVVHHLEHLQRSLERTRESLVVEGPVCLACSFAFPNRQRLSRPGRCPECRSTRVDLPRFSVR